MEGLAGDSVYRWRARLRYPVGNALGQVSGRWLYPGRNGPGEGDFRTGEVSGTVAAAGPVAVAAERPQPPESGAQAAPTTTPTGGLSSGEVTSEATSVKSFPVATPSSPFLPVILRDTPK